MGRDVGGRSAVAERRASLPAGLGGLGGASACGCGEGASGCADGASGCADAVGSVNGAARWTGAGVGLVDGSGCAASGVRGLLNRRASRGGRVVLGSAGRTVVGAGRERGVGVGVGAGARATVGCEGAVVTEAGSAEVGSGGEANSACAGRSRRTRASARRNSPGVVAGDAAVGDTEVGACSASG